MRHSIFTSATLSMWWRKESRRISKAYGRAFEFAFEISLRNHKPEPITVVVNEPIGGDWTMLDSNYKYEKTAAFAAQFTVPVAASAESVLKYRVRVQW